MNETPSSCLLETSDKRLLQVVVTCSLNASNTEPNLKISKIDIQIEIFCKNLILPHFFPQSSVHIHILKDHNGSQSQIICNQDIQAQSLKKEVKSSPSQGMSPVLFAAITS